MICLFKTNYIALIDLNMINKQKNIITFLI
jgi:hypothetical protein